MLLEWLLSLPVPKNQQEEWSNQAQNVWKVNCGEDHWCLKNRGMTTTLNHNNFMVNIVKKYKSADSHMFAQGS